MRCLSPKIGAKAATDNGGELDLDPAALLKAARSIHPLVAPPFPFHCHLSVQQVALLVSSSSRFASSFPIQKHNMCRSVRFLVCNTGESRR